MKFKWIQLLRYPHQAALPTYQEDMRGQVRTLSGNGATTADKLHWGRDSSGTGAFVELTNNSDTQTLANKTLTTPTIADFTNANHSHTGITGGGSLGFSYATFGPFYANDLAATATVALQADFFNTATAVSRSTPDVYMPVAGEIVGIFAITDADRTAGTATVKCVVNGVSQTFDGGAVCVIDATNVRRHSVFAARGNGEGFAAGNRISLEVVTSGWGPITADMTAWVTVRLNL